jgi:hypothetical protein
MYLVKMANSHEGNEITFTMREIAGQGKSGV